MAPCRTALASSGVPFSLTIFALSMEREETPTARAASSLALRFSLSRKFALMSVRAPCRAFASASKWGNASAPTIDCWLVSAGSGGKTR